MNSKLSGIESISNPFNDRSAFFGADRYDVEPARPELVAAVILQKPLRGLDDALLLGRDDAVRAATVADVATVPHFSEYQGSVVEHHQVDFTETGQIIPLQRFQATPFQERFGQPFPAAALLAGANSHAAPEPQAARRPRLMRYDG